MKTLEIRTAKGVAELRDGGADGFGVIAGYAAVFNRLSQNLGGFVEQVAPGAFTESVRDRAPVLCRYNHEDNYLLGTIEADTLRLSEDGTGLAYEADLPDTTAGRDVRALAKRGDLRYSSFAFYTLEDSWSVTEQDFPLRTLLRVQLVDVAPVNNPAYRDTTAAARSLCQRIGVERLDGIPKQAIREAILNPITPGAGGAGGSATGTGGATDGSADDRATAAALVAIQARRRHLMQLRHA